MKPMDEPIGTFDELFEESEIEIRIAMFATHYLSLNQDERIKFIDWIKRQHSKAQTEPCGCFIDTSSLEIWKDLLNAVSSKLAEKLGIIAMLKNKFTAGMN